MENERFTPMVNRKETFGPSPGSAIDGGSDAPEAALDVPERLALNYAPISVRPGFKVFFLLDAQLRRNAELPREPALIQWRLAWWRDALASTDRLGAASHPLLRQVRDSLPMAKDALTALVDGWEAVSVGEAASADAAELGTARATVIAWIAGEGNGVEEAARRWTFVEQAERQKGEAERTGLLDNARAIPAVRLARELRPLAVLDGLAKRALDRGGGPLLGDRLSPLAAIRLGIFGR